MSTQSENNEKPLDWAFDYVTDNADLIFEYYNRNGDGDSVDSDESEINELEHALGQLYSRSYRDDECAIYVDGNIIYLVGDISGPWCITVDLFEIDEHFVSDIEDKENWN